MFSLAAPSFPDVNVVYDYEGIFRSLFVVDNTLPTMAELLSSRVGVGSCTSTVYCLPLLDECIYDVVVSTAIAYAESTRDDQVMRIY